MAGLSKENPLRNAFNKTNITKLGAKLKENWQDFQLDSFLSEVFHDFERLQFGERNLRIVSALENHLPADFTEAAKLIIKSLGPELEPEQMAQLDDFIIMPQCGYIARRAKVDIELCLHALKELTKRMSAEGDLRAALEADYELTMRTLHTWCKDENSHVRRLVSEGTRPRLPLAGRIRRFQKDPMPVLELLEKLKEDDSLYVRRSVANNINDIAKDNPELALDTLEAWSKSSNPKLQWLVKHAARSLIKLGHKRAFQFLGFDSEAEIRVENCALASVQIVIGGAGEFSFDLISEANRSQNLVIDYEVNFMKANRTTKPKVFKYKNVNLESGETKHFSIKHKFVDTSGRKHYPGPQWLELKISGRNFARFEFDLQPQKSEV